MKAGVAVQDGAVLHEHTSGTLGHLPRWLEITSALRSLNALEEDFPPEPGQSHKSSLKNDAFGGASYLEAYDSLIFLVPSTSSDLDDRTKFLGK